MNATASTTVPAGKANYPRVGFWSLIVTQFQGAFNDNMFKYIIILYLLNALQGAGSAGTEAMKVFGYSLEYGANFKVTPGDFVPSFATLLFSLPFIIFPAFFGALADRFSKGHIARAVKCLEVGIMILGGLAFYLHSIAFLWVMLFLMATHSTMFSPAKYGLLPEMLPESRISWGNGILQMGTLVAIIAGTAVAGKLFGSIKEHVYYASFVLTGFSVLGLISSMFITCPAPANPKQHISLNPWAGMGRYMRVVIDDKVLLYVVVGYVYFWFAGALIQQNIIKYAFEVLHLSEDLNSYLLAAVALGIGTGAVVAGYLSRGKIEQGLILIGSLGMTLFALLIAIPPAWYGFGEEKLILTSPYYMLLFSLIFGLGFFAGIFDVPLASTLQQRAPASMRGGIISATNMLTFVGMACASLLFLPLGAFGFTPAHIFLLTGLFSLIVGVFIAWKLPLLALRAVLWAMDGTLFKVSIGGRSNLSERGTALIVADHNSILDTLAIQYALDREVCFVIGKESLDVPWMKRLSRFVHLVPVDSTSPEGLSTAEKSIRDLLAQGWVVCLSREPRLRPDGLKMPWHDDYHRLARDTGAPVIPLSMTRLWQRVYVFADNRVQLRWCGRLRYPVQVWLGAPLPDGTPGVAVRKAVEHVGMEAYFQRRYQFRLLHEGFVKMARHRMRHMAIADALAGKLSFFKVLVGAIVFARKLRPLVGEQGMVGLLVPPTVGGALANIAVQMLGKVPVNLNYTAPSETIAACAARCGITHIITSRKFLERLPLDVPGTPVYLEDVRGTVAGKDRIIGMLLAVLAPRFFINWVLGTPKAGENDIATVIFSSGSEGEPKGVMISHRNIMTIIESCQEMFPHTRESCVVGFLPLFHSFGFAVCLWVPLLVGIRGIYHPNPMEPKLIGNLIQKYGGSLMICTPTFLQSFIRRCEPEQLRSLEYVVAGAEKMPERIRIAFKEKFGSEPVEGYGTTECAPAVSLNVPDCESPGFYSRGLRHGTIGRPMTGQTVRVVDPDTGVELPTGEGGLLLVKGPNIMLGYLDDPKKTAAVLKDGWYATGDIAALDEDGFITITDRLARFSKIGGEMVPHTKIEEKLHDLLGLTEQSLIVASVPDESKGERLVVLHTLTDEQLDELLAKIGESDLPNLWRPRPTAFYRIEAIPVLGTGKMDLKQAKKLALALDVTE
jgi:acyl-[acyl-carrier-protein]-phospholipid O-acyltransferase/long-chain-fatty-acid--[acyl-carrier-protein] ligase